MSLQQLRKNTHQHVYYFRTLQGVVGMLRDPKSTKSVFDIEDGLRDLDATRLAAEYLLAIPSVRELATERWLKPVPDVDALAKLPHGTLGFHYAAHLRTNGFDPDYYRKFTVETDVHWLGLRMRQTHDIWHVVTGIGVDQIGELALKACELAQTRRPMAAVITAGGMLRYLMKDPDQLPAVMQGLYDGYTIGANAQPLLAQKWEERWAQPLAQVRAELGVRAGSYLPVTSPAPTERVAEG